MAEDYEERIMKVFGADEVPEVTDENLFRILNILSDIIEENDLIVKVKRLSDSKRFDMPLSFLSAEDEESEDGILLDDFATWVVNWS